MSTKSKANVSVVQGQIPEISQYLVEGDPNDPSSKPLFMPWKAALDREGSFKMSHKAVKASVVTTELEVIFLLIDQNTQCRCTTKEDKTAVVCYSHDREYSYKGYKCKDECPFAEKHIEDYKDRSFSRPLRRTVYFLFRPVGSEEEFKLARFTSVLNNTDAFADRKNKFRMLLAGMDVVHKYATANVAIIESTSESPAKGVVVGRLGTKVAYAASLDEAAVAKIKLINDALSDLITEVAEKQTANAMRARRVLTASGELEKLVNKLKREANDPDDGDDGEDEGGKDPGSTTEPEKTAPVKEEPEKETPTDTDKKPAKKGAGKKGKDVPKEEPAPTPPVIEDDDDDLPF